MESSAALSSCGCYRWNLSRKFDNSKKKLIFIGLNPSTANADKNDATIRRILKFASVWDFGSIVVINLFARISESPKLLRKCKDPIGKLNDFELDKRISYWANHPTCKLWLGWGVNGSFKNRDEVILKKIRLLGKRPFAIDVTKRGYPRHPLYVSRNKVLEPYNIG